MITPDKIYATVLNGHVTMAWSDWREDKTDVEYIRADIHEAGIDALKAENVNLEFLLKRVIGEHFAPGDCYATGPLTGNAIADLVSCPSCAALDYLARREV